MNFDDYAKNWDTSERIARAKIIADEISNSLDISKSCSAMEFGCGTGLVSLNLYNKFKNITLVDYSEGMIEVVKSKIDKYKVNNLSAYCVDIFKENSLDTKFDIIYNSMVLHHIIDTEAIAKKFYELLNPGGALCIVDLDEEDGSFHRENPDFVGHNGFNQENLKNILSRVGFKDIHSNIFYNDEKIIDGEMIKYPMFLMKAKK